MIEELLDETFENLEDDDVEELADKEVEKVLWEVTSGQLGQLSGTPTATPEDEGVSHAFSHAVEVSVLARWCTCGYSILCIHRPWVQSLRWWILMRRKI